MFVARFKKKMLRQPGTLIIEVARPDGVLSNQLMLEVNP
jgi:hypothetical protein